MPHRYGVGFIGTGNIFSAYVKGCRTFDVLDLVACADIDVSRALVQAEAQGIPKGCSVVELLEDPSIDIVINLTVPKVHAEVSLAAIRAGKHVYSEKPLAVTRDEGRRVLEAAEKAGVRLGCAPDTFLGGGHQTCRKLIDEGVIGVPVAAVAFMCSHGPESWHPNPDIFYQVGAGPMLDMGVYLITALVNLLGPARRVTGSARRSSATRVATSEERWGHEFNVEVPTHVAAVIDFAAGTVATVLASFDMWAHNLPSIEVYGSEGSVSVPSPNYFGGEVATRLGRAKEWQKQPLTHREDVGRGMGAADLAFGLAYERAHRASGELAYHVLDIMSAIEEASASGEHVELASSCDRPEALPPGLPAGVLD